MLIGGLDLKNSAVIDAVELLGQMNDPRLKIFDIRGEWGTPPIAKPDGYLQGHIPNAVYLDWTRELIDTDASLDEAPVPDDSRAQASFASLGIHEGDLVVLYDDNNHMFASRLWWVMRYFGLKNVKVLNGGWKHWCTRGYVVSTAVSVSAGGSFRPTRQEHLRCEIDSVIDRSSDTILLDGRGAESHCGVPDDPRTGHIPGAVNVPFRSLIDERSGLFKDDEEIKVIFAAAGIDGGHPHIISSCGSGYAGSVVLVALRKIGIDAALYDGSFSEWKKDPERPVAQVR